MTKDIEIGDPKTLLGKTISELREKRGLSQKGLAEAIGTTPQTMNKWERGKRWPEWDTLEAIAGALGVPVGELFRWEIPEPPAPSISALAAEVDRQAAEIARLKREKGPELTEPQKELLGLIAGLDEPQAASLLRILRRTFEILREDDLGDLSQFELLRKKSRG